MYPDFFRAPGRRRSGRRRRADARSGWPDVEINRRPGPRQSRGPGRLLDFQSNMSGHPPGAQSAPRRRTGLCFGRRNALASGRSSRRGRRVLRYYLACTRRFLYGRRRGLFVGAAKPPPPAQKARRLPRKDTAAPAGADKPKTVIRPLGRGVYRFFFCSYFRTDHAANR